LAIPLKKALFLGAGIPENLAKSPKNPVEVTMADFFGINAHGITIELCIFTDIKTLKIA
jgi:hypothetical protein